MVCAIFVWLLTLHFPSVHFRSNIMPVQFQDKIYTDAGWEYLKSLQVEEGDLVKVDAEYVKKLLDEKRIPYHCPTFRNWIGNFDIAEVGSFWKLTQEWFCHFIKVERCVDTFIMPLPAEALMVIPGPIGHIKDGKRYSEIRDGLLIDDDFLYVALEKSQEEKAPCYF